MTDKLATGNSTGSLDFTPGIRFPSSGPVFTLPAGFTADSVDASIVDNQVMSAAPVPAMGAPSMTALAMLLAALGSRAVGAARRRIEPPTLVIGEVGQPSQFSNTRRSERRI